MSSSTRILALYSTSLVVATPPFYTLVRVGYGLVLLYLDSQELRLKLSLTRSHVFLVYCSLVAVRTAKIANKKAKLLIKIVK
ncbi:hypothetical protein V6N13_088684 [Hibiscus sabdariffa]